MIDEITGVITTPAESQRLIHSYQQQSPEADAISVYRSDTVTEVVDIYLQQAQAYCDQKQWDKAAHACQEALQVAPTVAEAYRLLGSVMQKRGTPTDAMGFYAKAITLRPNFPEVYNNLGTIYAGQKHWEQAISYYQKAIDKDANFAPAYLNMAKALGKLGKDDRKNECLATAYRLKPELGTAKDHYQIGQTLEARGRQEEAIGCYQQAIAQDPKFIGAYQRLADLLEEQNDWQAAAVYYRKVMELSASGPSAGDRDADNYGHSDAGNSRAIATNGRAIAAGNAAAQAKIQRLVQASSQKQLLQPAEGSSLAGSYTSRPVNFQPANSQEINSQEIKAEKSPQQSTSSLAISNQSAAGQAQALPMIIRRLQRSIQQAPKSATLYRNLAKALDQNNQTKEAAEAWYRSFLLEPSWPKMEQCLELGDVLQQQGNPEGASNCYRQAIRLRPDFQPAYDKLDRLLRSQGNTKAADALLQRRAALRVQENQATQKKNRSDRAPAVATAPKADDDSEDSAAAQAAHNRGDALRKEESWAAAIAAYTEAVRLNPNFSWSHHSLGDCYKKLGNWLSAVESYRRAIALNAEFVWSYYSLAEVLESLEQRDLAAANYRQVLALDAGNEQVAPRLVSVLQALLKDAPRCVAYYQEIAQLLAFQGKSDEAIAMYQMALQIQPDAAEISAALAEMISGRDPQEALALRKRALMGSMVDVRSPAALKETQTVAALLMQTHLFDPVYYQATNPDIEIDLDIEREKSDLGEPVVRSLLLHYIEQGSAAGRNPNPLFDEAFYRAQHPEIAQQGLNSLAHYYRFGSQPGCDPHPFFSGDFYYKTHADIAAADINPLEHYLSCGAQEGRTAFSAQQCAPVLSADIPAEAAYLKVWQGKPTDEIKSAQRLGIYCNSLGNYFITEIADFIAEALTQAGHSVVRLSEKDTQPAGLDGHWVIAPHEFFYLGEGDRWACHQQWLSQAVMVNVEQPQTTWFSKAFHFLRHTKVIFDINVKSAAIMQQMGLPAYWLPLGYLPDADPFAAGQRLPNLRALKGLSSQVSEQLPALEAPIEQRPLDVHFIGTLNPRREQFFAQSARWLSGYKCFLHIPQMGVPLIKGQDQALDTAAVVGISRRSKILLNVHRDQLPYFEWHRIVFHGLWQNTLVVTEPCHDIPGLVAGEHFIECPLPEMEEKIHWLLSTPDGQQAAEQIRQAGYGALRSTFEGSQMMTTALAIAAALENSNSQQQEYARL